MRSRSSGFSLPELLVVLAILGLAIAVVAPIVSEQFRQAEIRGAADQLSVDLKAVRMIAVTQRAATSLTLQPDPLNRYSFTDNRGHLHSIQLPGAVRIVTPTVATPVTFQINGSVTGGATTVLEVTLSEDVTERWTLTTNASGVTRTARQRVAS